MKIIRAVNFYSYFLPIRIKFKEKNIGSLTSWNSVIEFDQIKVGETIEFSLGRSKVSVVYKGGNAVLIDQPKILTPLGVLSIILLSALLITNTDSSILFYLILSPTVMYIGAIWFVYLFMPSKFFKITEI